ncbi:long-chain fatty acid--CoA ligase [Pseudonocardia sp. MCCB 268]|nr:long-chain fatty acid--CoA ligase [Pseudonocardia cytotoxica]
MTGGENVYSVEVGKRPPPAPGIDSCAVVGVPDPAWGNVHAVLVSRPDTHRSPRRFASLRPSASPASAPRSISDGRRPAPLARGQDPGDHPGAALAAPPAGDSTMSIATCLTLREMRAGHRCPHPRRRSAAPWGWRWLGIRLGSFDVFFAPFVRMARSTMALLVAAADRRCVGGTGHLISTRAVAAGVLRLRDSSHGWS